MSLQFEEELQGYCIIAILLKTKNTLVEIIGFNNVRIADIPSAYIY
jgi:hypothetical protein